MTPEISILLKASLALVAGLLAARLARSASASVRHMVLATTFGALLVLPVAVLFMPEVALEVESRLLASEAATALPMSAGKRAESAGPAPAPREAAGIVVNPARSVSMTRVAGSIWLLGAVLLLSNLLLALWKLRGIRRQGMPWREGEALALRLARESGVGREVTVLLHETVSAPITCGMSRPMVVLPSDSPSWSEADLTRAFVHEIEHVRRSDWAVMLMARAACALYWFHPLVWVAWRKLCVEAERACDDAVLSGSEGADYADQLVTLARRLSHAHSEPALSMANRSDLSIRVKAVLDGAQVRGRAGAKRVAVTFVAACLGVVLLAPLTLVARAQSKAAGLGPVKQESRAARALGVALIEAADEGDVEAVAELLSEGADPDFVVQGDGTPLIAAARGGHLEVVRLLLERRADPNLGVTGDGNPLTAGAREGSVEIVSLLLDAGADIDLGIEGDGNALIMAAGDGRLEMVTLLLDRGANIEKVVEGDENPLIHASEGGHLDVVKLLLGRGADINARVWAAEHTMIGRKITKSQGEWRTALVMAGRNGHDEVVAYLKSQGATR